MGKNLFFVIDGMDGSGKSYMIEQLHNYLFSKDKKYRILTTREPTMGTHGKKIREMLATDDNPQENAAELVELFVKDREEHLNKVVTPFLENSSGDDVNIVLCDRYYHSTIAFQTTQGADEAALIAQNKNFLTPTCTFILDLAVDIALKRMSGRTKEKFEEPAFMEELRKRFLKLPEALGEPIEIIDASQDKQTVFLAIKKKVEEFL